jgi:tripartite-type tricarboxylate transporter receptor subunit TctC
MQEAAAELPSRRVSAMLDPPSRKSRREDRVIGKTCGALVVAGLLAAGFSAQAQPSAADYPERTVRFIVPFAAGGGVDVLTRMVAQRLSVHYGKPVVVENHVGGTGLAAVQYAGTSPTDGYTILVGAPSPFSVLPAVRNDLPFNNLRDFIPITLFGIAPEALSVHPAVPAKTVPELITHLKAHPGKLAFGNTGPGGLPHLSVALFAQLSGTQVVHVPYRGTAPALADVIAGHLHGIIDSLISQLGAIKQGQVRPLGVSLKERSPALPDVPTIGEFLPGYEATSWVGVFAAAGTPPAIVARIHADIARVLAEPEIRERMLALATVADGRSPDAFARFIQADIERWRNVAAVGHIKAE